MKRISAVAVVLLGIAWPASASARAQETFTYSRDIVWMATVRLLRVDLGYEISEQDRDNGYILFVVDDNGRTYNGSMEFVEGPGEYGSTVVDVALAVTGLPSATEEALLRKLKTKLRQEYGAPPRARPPVATPPATTDTSEEEEPGAGPGSDESGSSDDSENDSEESDDE